MFDDENYVEPEVMDEGGIVAPVKPKRTRTVKPNGGAPSNVKTKGGESGGGLFLVLHADKTYQEFDEKDMDFEAMEKLKDPTRRIVRAVEATIGKPVVSFGK